VSFLLDTNVVSELRKRTPHPNVVAWHRVNARADAYLSVLVIGEVRDGIEKLRARDPKQAESLDRWLQGLIRNHAGRILPVTLDVAQWWGRMSAGARSGGVRPPAMDGLMAATALVHRLTLVTRNVEHVASTGVTVVNPFQ
jgi:toxin FitB